MDIVLQTHKDRGLMVHLDCLALGQKCIVGFLIHFNETAALVKQGCHFLKKKSTLNEFRFVRIRHIIHSNLFGHNPQWWRHEGLQLKILQGGAAKQFTLAPD